VKANKMPAYLIIEIKIHDQELYAEYSAQLPSLVERYGGRYLIRGGEVVSVTGAWRPERLVLVQFETIDLVQDFLNCSEYQDLIPLRQRASSSRAIILEGYEYDF
jgi:uncharacterized protein (DUF1330 family)